MTWNQVVSQPATAPLANPSARHAGGRSFPSWWAAVSPVAGGIGISGGTAQQDHEVGVAALEDAGFQVAK